MRRRNIFSPSHISFSAIGKPFSLSVSQFVFKGGVKGENKRLLYINILYNIFIYNKPYKSLFGVAKKELRD